MYLYIVFIFICFFVFCNRIDYLSVLEGREREGEGEVNVWLSIFWIGVNV